MKVHLDKAQQTNIEHKVTIAIYFSIIIVQYSRELLKKKLIRLGTTSIDKFKGTNLFIIFHIYWWMR